jgi:hypothetical protein
LCGSGCFRLDFASIFQGILIVADPQSIERLVQPSELFNPGFQPSHIHSLSGSVVSETGTSVQRLRTAAERASFSSWPITQKTLRLTASPR